MYRIDIRIKVQKWTLYKNISRVFNNGNIYIKPYNYASSNKIHTDSSL